ncbi:MAG: hypothetical protein ACRDY7_03015 [Acidimicrobiia bacterium]
MSLWLVFLLLSLVFTLGWSMGSALGYQGGRRDAEALAELQAAFVHDVEVHLTETPMTETPTPAGAR